MVHFNQKEGKSESQSGGLNFSKFCLLHNLIFEEDAELYRSVHVGGSSEVELISWRMGEGGQEGK